MDLQKLIEEIKNGDEAAFAELYDRCKQHIALFCHRFSDTKEDAEEVLQDVFLAAHQNINSINPNAIIGYLRKTAVHKSINKRKANLRTQNYVVTVDDDVLDNYPELNGEFLPEQYFLYKEKHIELHNALESLPEMQMKMIYMYYFAGFKTKEIAQLLDVTQRHVINTLHIARNKLKSMLGHEETPSNIAEKLLPLGALLVIEEQVFAATYISTAIAPSLAAGTAVTAVATTTTATTTTTAATGAIAAGAKVYIAIACVLVAGAVATTSYFVFRPSNDYTPYELDEPAYEMQVPHEPETVTDPTYEPTSEPTPESTPEEPATEPTPEPIPEYTPEPSPEPTPENTPGYTPEPPPEPTPEPPADRTSQILSALSSANDAGSLSTIIDNYGFAFVRQMRSGTGEVRRLYVTNEGSGDILIGTTVSGSGTGWRMRFQHFVNGSMPTDPLDQLNFMN